MEFFEEAVSKAKDAFEVVSKKTGEVVSQQKQKFDLASMQSKISKDYETLGRLVYNTAEKDAFPEDVKALISQIAGKEADIETAKAELLKIKGKKICPKCGLANVSEAHFCYGCGESFLVD